LMRARVLAAALVLMPSLVAMGQAAGGRGGGVLGVLAQLFGGASNAETEAAAIRTEIGANAEEWKVIGPALRRLIAARIVLENIDTSGNVADAATGQPARRGMSSNDPFGGPGDVATGAGRGRAAAETRQPGVVAEQSPDSAEGSAAAELSKQAATYPMAMADLQVALADPQTDNTQIAEMLKRVRAARQRAAAEVAAAHQQLVELLTTGQEAKLMVMGYIE